MFNLIIYCYIVCVRAYLDFCRLLSTFRKVKPLPKNSGLGKHFIGKCVDWQKDKSNVMPLKGSQSERYIRFNVSRSIASKRTALIIS